MEKNKMKIYKKFKEEYVHPPDEIIKWIEENLCYTHVNISSYKIKYYLDDTIPNFDDGDLVFDCPYVDFGYNGIKVYCKVCKRYIRKSYYEDIVEHAQKHLNNEEFDDQ